MTLNIRPVVYHRGMRIACLYLPSLPLQVFLRGAPQWIGAPVAIVAAGARSTPTVIACSRAAWNAGLRPGISGVAAHESMSGLRVESIDHRAVKATVRALADALLGVTDVVDVGEPIGTHHAVYVAVPPRTRGASFGARLIEAAAAQGLRARVGIADDRFAAWVAASHGSEAAAEGGKVVTVPRGGSAAFLAPMPLSLLAISPEVQHVLGALGVRTLGDFATLPPPSTAHDWDADYQALARGDGGARLVAYEPREKIVERVAVGGEVGLGAALGLAARRVAARLAGRELAAVTLIVRSGHVDHQDALPLPMPAPTADEQDLSDAAAHLLREGATFVELEIAAAIAADAQVAAAATADGVPTAIAAEPSVPVVAPVFRLTPPDMLASAAREPHHRTRRGKQRSRAVVAAQSRLFAGLRALTT